MMNPYQAPPPPQPPPFAGPPNRTPFIMAGVGAFAASAYWAILTLLLGFAALTNGASGAQVIMPVILIVLYAYRGVNVMRGDARSARSLLALHAIGGIFAAIQIVTGGGGAIVVFLQALKVAIHIFGGITAHAANKAAQESASLYPNP